MAEAAVRLETDGDGKSQSGKATPSKSKDTEKTGKSSTTKPRGAKASSKTTEMKEMTERMNTLEESLGNKFDTMMQRISQYTGVIPPRTESNVLQGSSAPLRTASQSLGHETRRGPLISLNNGIDEPITDDILSLHPSPRERNVLGICDDSSDESVSISSDKSVNNRFQKFTNKDTAVLLKDLFGESPSEDTQQGIVLDEAQITILDKSWRADRPDKISAYKEDSKACLPVSKDSKKYLDVPGLDDLLEPMLHKRHGGKMSKMWGKSRQLCTQPLKAIETLGFQGQTASRLNIIAISYLQQGLGNLLSNLKADNTNIDRAIQSVRDLFDISNKALDQAGRSGAFHHLSRRKAAVSDTGLNTLKDVHTKVMYLPLSAEGVFGTGLQTSLKNRKDQKDQLNDLVPEFFERQKRKLPTYQDRANYKKPRVQYSQPKTSTHRHTYQPFNKENRHRESYGAKFSQAKEDNTQIPSFRIPKKK